jgi:hypothetical protein
MKQHLEQVDEVQIQVQRTHHRQLGVGVVAVMFGVFFLDPLGVIGGQAGEHPGLFSSPVGANPDRAERVLLWLDERKKSLPVRENM